MAKDYRKVLEKVVELRRLRDKQELLFQELEYTVSIRILLGDSMNEKERLSVGWNNKCEYLVASTPKTEIFCTIYNGDNQYKFNGREVENILGKDCQFLRKGYEVLGIRYPRPKKGLDNG